MTEEEFVDQYMRDWKNVVDENGKLVPFNRDEAIAMFKRSPGLFESFQEALTCE